ncbi:MAG: putative colanic acid biosynthesis acetyltransferase, partial [Flavobacteriaceae bacterium CG17_big_fil_post_rev_8_21_14_2_50_31_13]
MKLDLTKSTKGYSISLKDKLMRIIWIISWNCVRFLPKQFSFVKVFLLRCFGAEIGEKCLIDFGVKIWIPQNLVLKEGFVAIGKNVEIYNYAKVTIGRMTVVSQYCYLITGTHDYTNPIMPLLWKPITIGNEVWVAAGCWVFPGVSIRDGAVIAARSNVTKDMPAWQVCAGSPCKPFKER